VICNSTTNLTGFGEGLKIENGLPIINITSAAGCPIMVQSKFQEFFTNNWW
tara:strand:- start:661 stop:813 length:153 start_codon:yes stop_codon:yes gene_type:complete